MFQICCCSPFGFFALFSCPTSPSNQWGWILDTRELILDTGFWLLDRVFIRNKLVSQGYQIVEKLDGVAPLMTDPPPTNFTSFSTKKNIKNIYI